MEQRYFCLGANCKFEKGIIPARNLQKFLEHQRGRFGGEDQERKASISFNKSIKTKNIKVQFCAEELAETGTEAMSDGQRNQEQGHDLTAMVTGAWIPPSF